MSDPAGELDSSTPNEDAAALRFRAGIERMRRRWPAIAEAADNPVTEFLVRRQPDWSWKTFFIILGMALLLIGLTLGLALLWEFAGRGRYLSWIFPVVVIVGVSLLWSSLGGSISRRANRHSQNFALALEQARIFPELWLTPMTYREWEGALTGSVLLRKRGEVERALVQIIWMGLGIAGGFGLAALYRTAPTEPVLTLGRLVYAGGAAALWCSFLSASSDMEALFSSDRFYTALSRHWAGGSEPLRHIGKSLASMAGVVGATLASFAAVFGTLALLASEGWQNLPPENRGSILWAAAFVVAISLRALLPRLADRSFQSRLETGQRRYRELVHSLSEGK